MAVPVQCGGPVAGAFGQQGAQPGERRVAGRVGCERGEQRDGLHRAAGQQGGGGQVVALARSGGGVEHTGQGLGPALGQGQGGAQPGLPVGDRAGQGVGEGEGGGGPFALLGPVAAGDQQVGGLAQRGFAQRGPVAGGGRVLGGGLLPELPGGGRVGGQSGAGEPVAGEGEAVVQLLVLQRFPAGQRPGRVVGAGQREAVVEGGDPGPAGVRFAVGLGAEQRFGLGGAAGGEQGGAEPDPGGAPVGGPVEGGTVVGGGLGGAVGPLVDQGEAEPGRGEAGLDGEGGGELLPGLFVGAEQQGEPAEGVAGAGVAGGLGGGGREVGPGGVGGAEPLAGEAAEEQGLGAQRRSAPPRGGVAGAAAQRLVEGDDGGFVAVQAEQLGAPAEPEFAAAAGGGRGEQGLGLGGPVGAAQLGGAGEDGPVTAGQGGEGGGGGVLALCGAAFAAEALQPVPGAGDGLGLLPGFGAVGGGLQQGEDRPEVAVGGGGAFRGEAPQAPPGQLPGRVGEQREGLAVQGEGGLLVSGGDGGLGLAEEGEAALREQFGGALGEPAGEPGVAAPGLRGLAGGEPFGGRGEGRGHRPGVQGAVAPGQYDGGRTDQCHHDQQHRELHHAPSPCWSDPPIS
ncbi:hypothetical protein [Kitasatospora sp. NPDC051705]|uniref:hypothetical protein n=1 Tax=Kitasatospora sp. NPDC051705 TaxID=3364057 RepID=UPI00379312AD